MWKRQVCTGSLWSGADYFANRLVVIVATNVLVARALAPEGFGVFSTALTVSQSMWIVTDFGIALYGIREAARQPDPALRLAAARELQSLRLMLGLAVFAAMLVAVFASGADPAWRLPLALSGAFVLFYSVYPDWYFKAAGRFRELAVANALSSVLYVAAVALFVTGPGSLNTACALWACSFLPATVVLLAKAKGEGESLVALPALKGISHLKKSRHFLAGAVFNNLYVSMPVYMTAFICTGETLGHFNASYRLYVYASSVLLPVSQVFYPLLSKAEQAGGPDGFAAKLRFFQRLAFVIILPAALVIGMSGREIMLLLYGGGYEAGAGLFSFFAVPVVISTMRITLANPIAASGNQRRLAVLSFWMAGLSAAVGYALITSMGMAGAVLAVVACETAYIFTLAVLSSRCIGLSPGGMLSAVSWPALAGLALMGLVLRLSGGAGVAAVLAGLAVYAAALAAFGELNRLRSETC